MKRYLLCVCFFFLCVLSFPLFVSTAYAQNVDCQCFDGDDGKSSRIECLDQDGNSAIVACNDKKLCFGKPSSSIEFGKDASVPTLVIGGVSQLGNKGKGVECRNPTANEANITCKCLKPKVVGDGNNGFECTSGTKKTTLYCADANDACFNEPNNPFTIGLGTTPDENNIFDSDAAKGIRCKSGEETVEPTLPPPPPPPCATELSADGKCASFKTVFGNIQTNPEDFIVDIFGILLSISGAIALALIIRAGYTIMTSQGKPDQLQAGRDQLIAAIVGLLFLIFSFVILQTVGVDILKIPTGKGSVGDTGNSKEINNGNGNTNGNEDFGGGDFGGGDFGGGNKDGNEDFGGGDFGN